MGKTILVTGASGFMGQAVVPGLLDKGHTVYGLSRHPPKGRYGSQFIPVAGDVTSYNLGLSKWPAAGGPAAGVDAVLHMAAMLDLTERHRERVWGVNVGGTRNVVDFCKTHGIARLFFVSTAYTKSRNTYERSKEAADEVVALSGLRTTILKPGILIGHSRLHGLPPPGNFYTVVAAVDRVKRWIERRTGLPQLKLTIRLPGDPDGKLNLIPIDTAAEEIVRIVDQDLEGTFYITNPEPPSLGWVSSGPLSEAAGADIRVVWAFSPNSAEKLVHRLIRPLLPYLEGDTLPSSLGSDPPAACFPLDERFLVDSIRLFLKGRR